MKLTITWPNGNVEEVHAASRDELINSMWGSGWDEFTKLGGKVADPDDEEDVPEEERTIPGI